VLKGEDFFNIVPKRRLLHSQARLPDGTWTIKEPDGFFGFFAVLDGHNGRECGDAAEDFLLDDIMNCTLPSVIFGGVWDERATRRRNEAYATRCGMQRWCHA
jgi:serine/threonine protein phosphatase PrpC